MLSKKVNDHGLTLQYLTAHVRVARYRNTTQPMSRDERVRHASTHVSTPGNPVAREKWKRAGDIAKHAENDDTSSDEDFGDMDPQDREDYLRRKREAKAEREKMARTMGIEYFLEMVGVQAVLPCAPAYMSVGRPKAPLWLFASQVP
ncbi:hypothetical protein AUEXF2481DRAFT_389783 [Aureobasidium subglaciale EXF-2481]|uniref:Uncharacterized protein n=1 Tax=Aureobasidium subglaciale (strain EXF-2481) TaxID=1043005 RepID=A0A074YS81_AURSE|nr:uncharacterized protein AUEXF2481DRAFT_389783 [Aureobasidium subglaciale EXF-2481]KEQ99024.1 hypothetical protein AUEXF2481DRAFT_389783 [Aureobasidium subglaciale EXF-2481]